MDTTKKKMLYSQSILDLWAVYDGSMRIDDQGTQSYIHDWAALVGFGISYDDGRGYRLGFVPRSNLTQRDYDRLITRCK
jgi:hypothetical protein